MPRKRKDKSNWDLDPQKSSAAQFLTYIASAGAGGEKYEIRYEDEKAYSVKHYNLDVIIALGFKIENERADAGKDHMGLTTWEDVPDGKIQKYDVTIAKNYLTEEEIGVMERMVNAFLDFAELKTLDHVPLTMEDWSKQLEAFLAFFDRHPAPYAGDPVTAFMAQQHAETEFEKFKPIQDRLFMSDYDRFLLELENQVEEMGDKSGGFEHAE